MMAKLAATIGAAFAALENRGAIPAFVIADRRGGCRHALQADRVGRLLVDPGASIVVIRWPCCAVW
jgi:hypothetical protein